MCSRRARCLSSCVVVIVLLTSGACKSEESKDTAVVPTRLSREDAFDVATSIVNRINSFLEERRLEPLLVLAEDFSFRYRDDTMMDLEYARIGSRGEPIRVSLLSHNGHIFSIMNTAAWRRAEALEFLKAPPPQLTEQEAVELARGYVSALVGHFPKNTLPVESRYISRMNGSNRHKVGEWSISWTRTDSKGRAFLGDDIYVSILGHIPITAAINFRSNYPDDAPEAAIAEEEAGAIAARHVRQIASCRALQPWLGGYRAGTVALSSKLAVVNPNHITCLRDIHDMRLDLNARLSWLITFEAVYAGKPGANVPAKRVIEVWIDALTGELLGGDDVTARRYWRDE